MNHSEWLFWNVDTQKDFIMPNGKLYVPGAEKLTSVWKDITQLAKNKNLTVVSSADFHYPNSGELSPTPDFIKTFPEHCMANTPGAEFIDETLPENPLIFNWDTQYNFTPETINPEKNRNIVIRKDAFDVFSGNRFTEQILKNLSPAKVVVYGVTTNVCVNDAVVGLAKRVKKVFVVEDAIKELPNIPLPFDTWKALGVKLISFNDLKKIIPEKPGNTTMHS